jgi:aspartate-semialdehyde dehydrogenase
MKQKDTYRVAILGATGNVGRLLLEIVEARNFPVSELKLLASKNSVSKILKSPKGKEYKIELACPEAFEGIDIVFASAGSQVSSELAPEIKKRGGVLIDNSSHFRMYDDVPLVVPEVNGEEVLNHKGIISNPNCSTAPLTLALKPLEKFGLRRVVVSTYQSISGAGKAAMEELKETSKLALEGKAFTNTIVNQKIAFNLIPQIDKFLENGYTKEEMKLINESRKILKLPNLKITCTAVRVPVFISHSESVNIELEKKISKEEFIRTLERAPEVVIQDDPFNSVYPMPLDVTGKDPVFIGRIRIDESCPNAFNFWLVSDNLRIGAALNTVRIGEELIKRL